MKKISQREAQRLRKRVAELEDHVKRRLGTWSSEWPGGVHLAQLSIQPDAWATLNTARRLKFAVVMTTDTGNRIDLYAVQP